MRCFTGDTPIHKSGAVRVKVGNKKLKRRSERLALTQKIIIILIVIIINFMYVAPFKNKEKRALQDKTEKKANKTFKSR